MIITHLDDKFLKRFKNELDMEPKQVDEIVKILASATSFALNNLMEEAVDEAINNVNIESNMEVTMDVKMAITNHGHHYLSLRVRGDSANLLVGYTFEDNEYSIGCTLYEYLETLFNESDTVSEYSEAIEEVYHLFFDNVLEVLDALKSSKNNLVGIEISGYGTFNESLQGGEVTFTPDATFKQMCKNDKLIEKLKGAMK